MASLRNVKFGTRVVLLTIGSVVVTAICFLIMTLLQRQQSMDMGIAQLNQAIDSDLTHVAENIYTMVQAQDEAAQQRIALDLNVARRVLDMAGQVSFAPETVTWEAVDQFSQRSTTVRLPKFLVGEQWLGQNTDSQVYTPVVDDIETLVGTTATVFQRMNADGDMLRVATTVRTADGQRAVGTYIPAVEPDGRPNAVIAAILQGQSYYGTAFVVDAWYLTAYEPIVDSAGEIVGMLYVGVERDEVATAVRQAILQTRVGESGYVYVLGSTGDELGRYIISRNGERDGEDIWDVQDPEGRYVVRSIVETALRLEPGEVGTERYLWQNLGDPAPRWKIARLVYYEPWHWVIGVAAYEDELYHYEAILQQAQRQMLVTLGVVGLVVMVAVGMLSVWISRLLTRPVSDLVAVVERVAAGDLTLTVPVRRQDEVGALAQAFNSMTAQLREQMEGLEQRVADRTADIERRSRYLAAQAEIARASTAILDIDALIQQIVEMILEQFDLYYVGLFTVDESGEWVVLRAGTGKAGEQLLTRGYRRRVGDGMIGWTIANRQVRVAQDVTQDPVRLPIPELPLSRSEVTLPLRSGERVWGAISLQSRYANRFDPDLVDVLQTMTDQVAIAMENARLLAATQGALEAERRAYGEVTRTAWAHLVEALGERGFRSSLDGVGPAWGDWTAEMKLAVQRRRVVTGGDGTAAVPVVVRDQVIGVLNFEKAGTTWTEEEVAVLETLADQLGVALDSARLYQDTQRRAARERLIGEVTARMRESLDMQTVLKTAADQVRRAFGLEDFMISLTTVETLPGDGQEN